MKLFPEGVHFAFYFAAGYFFNFFTLNVQGDLFNIGYFLKFEFYVPRPNDISKIDWGGVLERDGHTEASVDFCKLAGLQECGVLSEICNEDGSMSRVPELRTFCEQHGLVLTSIHDLREHLKAM